jgi:hypothetical protein
VPSCGTIPELPHVEKGLVDIRQRFLSEHPQEEPKGVRAWNCRITAASIPGIEIANEVHPSGTQ